AAAVWSTSSSELVQQRLRLFQIARVESFGEPTIDRSEKLASFVPLTLVVPEPRHAHGGAEFPRFRLLSARYSECTLEICFRFRSIGLLRLERDCARDPVGLGLEPSFFGCFDHAHRFAHAAPSFIKL